MQLTREELKEIYPEHPDIYLTPGGAEARAKGCNCVGHRPGLHATYVHPDCPLGHGKRGWGLGAATPGSPYARDLNYLRKIRVFQLAEGWRRWLR